MKVTKFSGGNAITQKNVAPIGGGEYNNASGFISAVASGIYNTVSGNYSFIGGGYCNRITGSGLYYSSVLGGRNNIVADSVFSSILGGANNTISSVNHSSILGGSGNSVTHDYAGAFGCNVSSAMGCAFHANQFVAQNMQNGCIGLPVGALFYCIVGGFCQVYIK